MPASCIPTRRLIAEGPACKVEECSCGVLHVTLGALTLRLEVEVVMSVWSTLGEAIRRVSRGRRDRQGASPEDAAAPVHARLSGERPS